MTPHHYNCHSCQEPLTVSIAFQSYILANGMQSQCCNVCNAVHSITKTLVVTLTKPGVLIARLSAVYEFPEYKPYRTGAYRVWFSGYDEPARRLAVWNGKSWCNGPIVFSDAAVKQWQGLGGDMEHTKRMPYEHDAPFPFETFKDDTCD